MQRTDQSEAARACTSIGRLFEQSAFNGEEWLPLVTLVEEADYGCSQDSRNEASSVRVRPLRSREV